MLQRPEPLFGFRHAVTIADAKEGRSAEGCARLVRSSRGHAVPRREDDQDEQEGDGGTELHDLGSGWSVSAVRQAAALG